MTAEGAGGPAQSYGRRNFVEATLMGAFGIGAIAASLACFPGWLGAAGAVLAALMFAIGVVDCKRLIIPDELNALAFVAGLAAVGLLSKFGAVEALGYALLRAAAMFGVFFAFRAGYRRLRGVEGMGLGDVKLAAVAGVWLNWTDLPIAVDIAALCALAWVLFDRLRGKEYALMSKLPFGAFFAPAISICWLLAQWRGDGMPA